MGRLLEEKSKPESANIAAYEIKTGGGERFTS